MAELSCTPALCAGGCGFVKMNSDVVRPTVIGVLALCAKTKPPAAVAAGGSLHAAVDTVQNSPVSSDVKSEIF
jgi:hypothetical protein